MICGWDRLQRQYQKSDFTFKVTVVVRVISIEPSVAMPVTVTVYVPVGVPPVAVLEAQQPESTAIASTAETISIATQALRRRRYFGIRSRARTLSAVKVRLPGRSSAAVAVLLGAVVWMTSFDVPEPPVTVVGVSVQVVWLGSPEQVSATSSVKPVSGVTVAV